MKICWIKDSITGHKKQVEVILKNLSLTQA